MDIDSIKAEEQRVIGKLDIILDKLLDGSLSFAKHLLIAVAIYFVGRFIIRIVNKALLNTMNRRKLDPAVKSFVSSTVNITLTALLILSVIGALGVHMTSFAALLASVGVAIGMALSGNLQNFAGGLVLLLLRPYRIGDFIEIGNQSGTVKSIQIFNTILTTVDNKTIYIPNASISNGVMTNYSDQTTRRVDMIVGVEYGSEYNKVKDVLMDIIKNDPRILSEPEPFVALDALADSSVNLIVKVWAKTDDYWNVRYDLNKTVYERFNAEGIGFPFPQLTLHKGE